MDNQTPLLELKGITKTFGSFTANEDINLTVYPGEVHALLGENGAGKSTLMNVIYGIYKPDRGEVFLSGKPVRIHSPKDALRHGIGMVHQHFMLVDVFSVIENIGLMGDVKTFSITNRRKIEDTLEQLKQKYGIDVDLHSPVGQLSIGMQQKVEILKALYLKTSLLIMDEPTAVLTPQESETLMQFVKEYTAKGNSVIFITHKMKEVMEVADRIIVMRNGRLTGNLTAKETNEVELARLMMGKEMVAAKRDEEQDDQGKKVCLELKNVTVKHKGAMPVLDHLTFQIMEGEIFGVAGVSGNGQEELCEVICGALPVTEGSVFLKGKDITGTSVRERIGLGIGYVPVDRYRDAMVGDMTLAENMMLKTSFDRTWTRHGFLNRKKLYDHTQKAIEDFEIKAPGPDAQIRGLSGGNQQKVILGRWLLTQPDFLILDEPTRGIDIGTKTEIQKLVLKLAEDGMSVVFISSEIEEMLRTCSRMAVLRDGEKVGELAEGELSQDSIMKAIAGGGEE
mgnify:CR=1 FL=1